MDLSEFRKEIDFIDEQIVELLRKRFSICDDIAEYKRTNGLPIENIPRETEVLARITESTPSYSTEITNIFSEIMTVSKRIQRKSLNVYLIGMSGCGKSRTARLLSPLLGLPHVDTDKQIMSKAGNSIDVIFDTVGEAAFRHMETAQLLEIAHIGGHIVATGGGILTKKVNISLIRNSGIVIFLDRSFEALLKQRTKNRPLIRSGQDSIRKLYSERYSTYTQCADLVIDPDSHGYLKRIVNFYNDSILK